MPGGGEAFGGVKCATVADCPQPGDPHCGTATCENGICDLTLTPLGPISSQVRGDCKETFCDGNGNLIQFKEASDNYDDGLECTVNVCAMGEATSTSMGKGTICPETGQGFCYNGACVACIPNMNTCAAGTTCDGMRCVPLHCVNDQWDSGFGETAEDCGGLCAPCAPPLACKIPADCRYGVCSGGICQPPTCSDGVKNDNETGADCGGPSSCPRCPAGEGCKVGSDCVSQVCWAGMCEPPACSDGIKNGDETGWDCGGSCGPCP